MSRATAIVAAAALAVAAIPGSAMAQSRAKVGTLGCDISAGVGYIVTSQKQLRCSFEPSGGGRREAYVGTIRKFGIDIGATEGGRMIWGVYASYRGRRPGALAGVYTGASAEATVGAGLGANVLVGGSDRSVALQPLSVQGQAGLNLAVGVGNIELQSVQPVRYKPRAKRHVRRHVVKKKH